jgi:aspartate/methionine/tyrosine aminotransferase
LAQNHFRLPAKRQTQDRQEQRQYPAGAARHHGQHDVVAGREPGHFTSSCAPITWARIPWRLVYDILEKAHVGVTPGIDFRSGGEVHLRFSYTNSLENIEKGLDRLGGYIVGIAGKGWVERRGAGC